MAMIIKASDTCDRCGSNYNEREVDVETLSKEQGLVKGHRFKLAMKGQADISYTDLCPSCEKTLGKIYESAGPKKRSGRGRKKAPKNAPPVDNKGGGEKPPKEPKDPKK